MAALMNTRAHFPGYSSKISDEEGDSGRGPSSVGPSEGAPGTCWQRSKGIYARGAYRHYLVEMDTAC